jgi:hypothetical protein
MTTQRLSVLNYRVQNRAPADSRSAGEIDRRAVLAATPSSGRSSLPHPRRRATDFIPVPPRRGLRSLFQHWPLAMLGLGMLFTVGWIALLFWLMISFIIGLS